MLQSVHTNFIMCVLYNILSGLCLGFMQLSIYVPKRRHIALITNILSGLCTYYIWRPDFLRLHGSRTHFTEEIDPLRVDMYRHGSIYNSYCIQDKRAPTEESGRVSLNFGLIKGACLLVNTTNWKPFLFARSGLNPSWEA